MATVKLANVVQGNNTLVTRKSGYIDTSQTVYNSVKEYAITNCYTTNPSSHEVVTTEGLITDDCGEHSGNVLGIVYNNKCLTTTVTEQEYVYTTGTELEIRQSNWQGMLFNNYVTSGYQTSWIFECIFQPYAAGNLLTYGYPESPIPSKNCTRYRVYVENGQVKVAFSWSNGSKYYTTTMAVTSSTCGSPTTSQAITYEEKHSTSTLSANAWYHLCLARIGDGNTSHGSGAYSGTLCYLAKIKDYPGNLSVYQNQSNSIYYYSTLASRTVPSGFGFIGSTTTAGNVGRLSGSNELSGIGSKVTSFYLGDSNVRLAGNVFLYGGAYNQQMMRYNIDTNNLYFSSNNSGYNSSLTYLGVGNYNSATTTGYRYVWKDSLIINGDGTITQN